MSLSLFCLLAGLLYARAATEAQEQPTDDPAVAEQWDEAMSLFEDGELRKAWTMANRIVASHPDQAHPALLLKYLITVEKGDAEVTRKLGQSMWATFQDDPDMLVSAALAIVDLEAPGAEELRLAEKMAGRANELAGGKDYDVLGTLAEVYLAERRFDQALASVDALQARAGDDGNDDAVHWAHTLRFEALVKKKDYAAAQTCGEQLLAATKDDSELIGDIFQILLEEEDTVPKDLELAEKLITRAGEITVEPEARKVLQQVRVLILLRKEDHRTLNALGDLMIRKPEPDPYQLIMVAEIIVSGEEPPESMVALAERLLLRANDATQGRDPEILTLLADFYHASGQLEKAIEMQTKALEQAQE
jgi:tetratricopeptide (TPR) repeat protein